jgi:hypothetical protein
MEAKTMKKILALVAILTLYKGASAGVNMGNFRFGLKVQPNLTWLSPEDKKVFTSGGAKATFTYGLMVEYKLNSVASLATGFDFSSFGGRLSSVDTQTFYNPVDVNPVGKSVVYVLSKRSYSVNYFEIPITLKMRTGEQQNGFTYFGVFGVNVGFRGKSMADDEGYYKYYSGATPPTFSSYKEYKSRPDNNVSEDVNWARIGLNVAVGAEYKLGGSTALVMSLHYLNGFTNALTGASSSVIRSTGTSTAPADLTGRFSGASLNIGILF